jgi:proteasome accessory factor B
MSAAKLERLLNLTAALLETPTPLTAEQVRALVPGYPDELAAFRRAFERDKDDLREMGIPLRLERTSVGHRDQDAYRIPKDEYYLRDPGFEPDELAALHLAAQVVRLEGASEALWKLGGDPAGAGSGGGDALVTELALDANLTSLFGAIAARHPVRFGYPNGPAGEPGWRHVEPHRLDFQRGRWYVSGHDRDREAPRSFRVDRLVGDVEVLPATFAKPARPHPGVSLQPWELGGEAVTDARLLVDADQAGWAAHYLGAEAVQATHADGAVELRVPVTNLGAFRSFVLTFLDHAEVLGPPELRLAVTSWLEELAGAG